MWTDFLASSWILLADWNLLSVSKYTQRQSYFQLLLYGLEVNRSETRCVLLVVVLSSSLWSDKRVIDIPISDRLQQPIQSLKRWLTITILSNCDTMPQKCRATPNLASQQSTYHIFFCMSQRKESKYKHGICIMYMYSREISVNTWLCIYTKLQNSQESRAGHEGRTNINSIPHEATPDNASASSSQESLSFLV